ncbi:uncharacterized protein LOC116110519 [Pistacia vera]|uniref:uncharacterized protein LOC116110519 n=1 Tax=Pistacia vera TaxID=55513 RepID=UPI001262E3A7|nr:uncharacterized protein LOC116110519 [Pistacia vera]
MTIKGQTLADFISEFSYQPEGELNPPWPNTLNEIEEQKPKLDDLWQWTLYVDGSSNEKGVGGGLLLESPEGNSIRAVISFGFAASNNGAEYEALLIGIHLTKEIGVESIKIYSDSQLIPREKNSVANALARLAFAMNQEKVDSIPVKFLPRPSIFAP